jgi:hypothetical protein
VLKGSALVAGFIGFLATCAALIAWWDSTWQKEMSPYHQVRSISDPPCVFGEPTWCWWRSAGCRVT